jgi:uracil-DNA glycosylase family 4
MNAHDRLRLYLEQRRELGESELVLDALPVEAVMKILGSAAVKTSGATADDAPIGRSAATTDPNASNAREAEHAPPPSPVAPPAEPAPRFDTTAAVDWRTALSGLRPGSDAKKPASSGAPSTAPESAGGKTSTPQTPAPAESSPAPASLNPSTPVVVGASQANGNANEFPAWVHTLGLPLGIVANPPGDASTTPKANAAGSIDELATVIAACRACGLGASAINPVPGEGNINADFVCVGEAPGQTEDETGRPFVGAAGQLLTKILGAIQLQREDVFICNVLKHRPPGNRNPAPDEIRACTPYLTRQLELVRPKVILALGTFAAQTLLNTTTPLGKLRGQVHRYQGVPLIVTYHPAALLRNESWKRPTWEDVKLAKRILDAARLNDAAST